MVLKQTMAYGELEKGKTSPIQLWQPLYMAPNLAILSLHCGMMD